MTGYLLYQCRGWVCGYIPQSGTAPAKTAPILKNLKKNTLFSRFFRVGLKRIRWQSHYIQYGENFPKKILRGDLRMRANHVLVPKGWYWVSTDVNNREGVFQLSWAVQMLREVLHDARKVYEFEVRGLRVEDDRVSFYINAVDGFAVIFLNRGHLPQKPFQF
jgi:hypothetical protein